MTKSVEQSTHIHFRTVAMTITKTAKPEISEIATVDGVWEAGTCSFDSAELQLFSTSAGEDTDGLPACNPSHLANLVWEPPPSFLVAHDAPAAQLFISHELTKNLPWVDTYRVARVLWPNLYQSPYLLEALVKRLRLRSYIDGHVSSMAARSPAAWNAVATAALLGIELNLASEWELQLSSEEGWLTAVLGPLAAPRWMQEIVRVSAKPAPPLRELPAGWDDDVTWATFSDQDLAWALTDDPALFSRDGLLRELERRRLRQLQIPLPLLLCRPGPARLF